MNNKLWKKFLHENKLNEKSEKKWKVFFVTALRPSKEDAEGWISSGKDEKEAINNLHNFFKKQGYGKNRLKWYYTESSKYNGNEKPYTQVQ